MIPRFLPLVEMTVLTKNPRCIPIHSADFAFKEKEASLYQFPILNSSLFINSHQFQEEGILQGCFAVWLETAGSTAVARHHVCLEQ